VFEADSKHNSVLLTNICEQNQFCDIPIPQWNTLANANNGDIYVCSNNDTITPNPFRYPGEHCEKHDNCVVSDQRKTGRCTAEKMCDGQKEYQECSNHMSCWKGLYCDLNKHQCVKQLPLGSPCSSSTQCQNKYLCHLNKCAEPFSLEVGTQVDVKDVGVMLNVSPVM
jgi:hypothetical protein